MKKTLQYNEYGAPIQHNPMWCNFLSWILRKIGNLFYPNCEPIAVWFWVRAYAWGDIQCLSGIKGYES